MNDRVIGTCGNCGGPVVVPFAIWKVGPVTPKCRDCGSVPAQAYGPVIPMEPKQSDDPTPSLDQILKTVQKIREFKKNGGIR